MNQKLYGGLTAALLITTLGVAPSSYAGQVQTTDSVPDANSIQKQERNSQTVPSDTTSDLTASVPAAAQPPSEDAVKMGEQSTQPQAQPATLTAKNSEPPSVEEVVKVGEQQPTGGSEANVEVIAKIYPHQQAGRKAATLYVRNIPVLTFLGDRLSEAADPTIDPASQPESNESSAQVKALNRQPAEAVSNSEASESELAPKHENDPVWRASEIASILNQLNLKTVDASTITVSWRTERDAKGGMSDRYTIKVNGKDLVEVSGEAILPDTTRDVEQDALQVTNRLRRLLANAAPLQEVPGKPARPKVIRISFAPGMQMRFSGMASWYGPGFHGAQSASGEMFNQYALTAAHRTLPFGTRVRVTNLDNGKSVVVRINDRGPYSHGRVIDLSAGAANLLGLISSGVAPVRLEVLGER
ncbi:MAG: septal ring lytic transglycosylase RlpA family protein [Scytolyngbya sp. HA4215-MV1]|jgi:rare lipoprotein A|nr:septal ring lytic transglycosylase RlpA family protein [Scytolyngbya sp. HA4215-MV1]